MSERFPPLNTLDVAFRRGVAPASAVAAVVLLLVLGLTAWAVHHQHVAEERLVRLNVATGIRLVDEGDLFGALPWLAEALWTCSSWDAKLRR